MNAADGHRPEEEESPFFSEPHSATSGTWPLLDPDVDDEDAVRRRRSRWVIATVGVLLGVAAAVSATGLLEDAGAGPASSATAGAAGAGTQDAAVADAASTDAAAPGGDVPVDAMPGAGGSEAQGGADTGRASPPQMVGGFAEAFVSVYLGRAGEDAEAVLAPYLAGAVDLSGVTPAGLFVQRSTALDVAALDEGYWAVTVAAEVLSAVGERYEPAGLRYYTVGVVARDGRLAAVAPPTQVPAPPDVAVSPEVAVALGGVGADGAAGGDPGLADAVERFLDALLAGHGDLTVASGVSPIRPAPYTDVAVRRLGLTEQSSGASLVRAEVRTTDAAGLVGVLDYSLELRKTDGQWQVVRLHAAPPLAQP